MYQSYCGIDFGTTNSAVSVVTQGKTPELIRFGKGKETIPTAIFSRKKIHIAPRLAMRLSLNILTGLSDGLCVR